MSEQKAPAAQAALPKRVEPKNTPKPRPITEGAVCRCGKINWRMNLSRTKYQCLECHWWRTPDQMWNLLAIVSPPGFD